MNWAKDTSVCFRLISESIAGDPSPEGSWERYEGFSEVTTHRRWCHSLRNGSAVPAHAIHCEPYAITP